MVAEHDPSTASPGVNPPGPAGTAAAQGQDGPGSAAAQPRPAEHEHPRTADASQKADHPEARQRAHPWRRRLMILLVLAGLAYGAYFLVPAIETALNTVSTDDAYVNGHVTFVAPRVAGQVSRGLGRRQLSGEEGQPAGPARQGAVPGSTSRSSKPP